VLLFRATKLPPTFFDDGFRVRSDVDPVPILEPFSGHALRTLAIRDLRPRLGFSGRLWRDWPIVLLGASLVSDSGPCARLRWLGLIAAGNESSKNPSHCPGGRQLVALEDAGRYITKLPKAEHEAEEWQAAIEALMLVARRGPTMLARIGVMRALNRNVERVFTSRKDHHWGRRKLARDRPAGLSQLNPPCPKGGRLLGRS
jgi:hypothetical protein